MRYTVIAEAGKPENLVVFLPGEANPLLTADSTHSNYQAIKEKVVKGETDGLVDLFDPSKAVAAKFERLSDRVSVQGGKVFFDGDEVHNVLTEQVVRFVKEGEDAGPLVKFWENLAQNPNEHSREHLYRWLRATNGFTITDDGMLVGYKGVRVDNQDKDKYVSVHAGPAVVDGVSVNGNVPNMPGTVVEMARSKVQHAPGIGCSTGLHVGTWDYARSFGQVTLEVRVHPRDVVSVPTDCSDRKMRVCRYKVVKVTNAPYNSAVVPAEDYAAVV